MIRVQKKILTMMGKIRALLAKFGLFNYRTKWTKINLCGGPTSITQYCNVDIFFKADLNIDLEKINKLPFKKFLCLRVFQKQDMRK